MTIKGLGMTIKGPGMTQKGLVWQKGARSGKEGLAVAGWGLWVMKMGRAPRDAADATSGSPNEMDLA